MQLMKLIHFHIVLVTIALVIWLRNSIRDTRRRWYCILWWSYLTNMPTIRGNMLMMQILPKVIEAYKMFSQEEIHKEISVSSHSESMAMMSDKRRYNESKLLAIPWNKTTITSKGQLPSLRTQEELKPISQCPNITVLIVRFQDIKLIDASKSMVILQIFKGFKDKRTATVSSSVIWMLMHVIHHLPCPWSSTISSSTCWNQLNPPWILPLHASHSMIAGTSLCFLSSSNSKWLLY